MGNQGASFNPKNSSYGLELHWVQGGPIVTLARLFLFLFTPYSNWPNTWLMKMTQIQAQNKAYTTLYNVYKTRLKNGREDNN